MESINLKDRCGKIAFLFFCLVISIAVCSSDNFHGNVPISKLGLLLRNTALYPNDSIVNDQVCPDITVGSFGVLNEALAGKIPSRTITVNLPRHDGRTEKNYDIPCNFKVKGTYGKTTNVGIRGIHRSSAPWNYDLSDNCPSFVKFRINPPSLPQQLNQPEVICRIWKLSVSQQQPKLLHPIVWYFPNRKVGISFPPSKSVTRSGSKNATGSSTTEYKYLHIVFTVSTGQSCSIRVQQYVIGQRGQACNGTSIPGKFRSCGVYRCSDHVHLMNQLGSWTYINWGMNGEFEEPAGGVLLSQYGDRVYSRRRPYWFTAAVRTSIVPILFFGMIFLGYKFFCVLYPSYPVLSERRARSAYNQSAIRAFNGIPIDASNLRDSLSAPRRQLPPRHLHLPGNADSILPCQYTHFSNNIRNVRLAGSSEDPPPDYESLSPPTYSEATKL